MTHAFPPPEVLAGLEGPGSVCLIRHRYTDEGAGILLQRSATGAALSLRAICTETRFVVGLRDTFDFDDAPRGAGYKNPFLNRVTSYLAGQVVGLVEKDANNFCPGGANPVAITGGKRR